MNELSFYDRGYKTNKVHEQPPEMFCKKKCLNDFIRTNILNFPIEKVFFYSFFIEKAFLIVFYVKHVNKSVSQHQYIKSLFREISFTKKVTY